MPICRSAQKKCLFQPPKDRCQRWLLIPKFYRVALYHPGHTFPRRDWFAVDISFNLLFPYRVAMLRICLTLWDIKKKTQVKSQNHQETVVFSSWWLNQPIWKIFVKLDHFPKVRGESKKHLKPPSDCSQNLTSETHPGCNRPPGARPFVCKLEVSGLGKKPTAQMLSTLVFQMEKRWKIMDMIGSYAIWLAPTPTLSSDWILKWKFRYTTIR